MRSIVTRNFGNYEPGFYRRLANTGFDKNDLFQSSSTAKRKASFLVVGKKLNYCVVKMVLNQSDGLETIRGCIGISNEQCNALSSFYQLSGKFKYFPGLAEKLKIATRIIKVNRSIRITQLQVKVVRKPKVVFCDGEKIITLNDGYSLHFMLKKN